MNRCTAPVLPCTDCNPHAGGGEPTAKADADKLKVVIPTQVGMNRHVPSSAPCAAGNPHAGGDEPAGFQHAVEQIRNPHTRGDEPPELVHLMDAQKRSPHTRGDEPVRTMSSFMICYVVPTHVGMNRTVTAMRS